MRIASRVIVLTFAALCAPAAVARLKDWLRVGPPDGSGEYSPGYQGVIVTNARGEYVLRTALPGNYGRPRHIHISASHPDKGSIWTEIVFQGDPMLDERDREHAIALETVRIDGREHKVGTFDMVLGAN